MQTTLRLARARALPTRRCLATAASFPASASSSSSSSSKAASVIPLSNVEAQWRMMGPDDKATVHAQLEALNQKDWKTLSIDEKKAAYYVSFGPHGPRTPVSKPGDGLKIFGGVALAIGFTAVLFFGIRATAPDAPKTVSKEWQEATNELAVAQNMNPITGISSEGYKGTGFVVAKK